MPNEEDEERLLRSVAFQNAKSILLARQRAERALLEANEALELKTQELSEANRRLSESEAALPIRPFSWPDGYLGNRLGGKDKAMDARRHGLVWHQSPRQTRTRGR